MNHHITANTMEDLWERLVVTFLSNQLTVCEGAFQKGPGAYITLLCPRARIPFGLSDPFSLLFRTLLALSGNDDDTRRIAQIDPLKKKRATTDESAIGYRTRRSFGIDQLTRAANNIRANAWSQVILSQDENDSLNPTPPMTICATLSAEESLNLHVTMQYLVISPATLFDELFFWSMYHELAAAHSGIPLGYMSINAHNTIGITEDVPGYKDYKWTDFYSRSTKQTDLLQEFTIEEWWSDLATFCDVGTSVIGSAYTTPFFRRVVLLMQQLKDALSSEGSEEVRIKKAQGVVSQMMEGDWKLAASHYIKCAWEG